MKFNYVHYLPESKDTRLAWQRKYVIVTIAYTDTKYAFAVQSPSDQHNKKIGRRIAENRLRYGLGVDHLANMSWPEIKEAFDTYRKYSTATRIPRFLQTAKRIPSKNEYRTSVLASLIDIEEDTPDDQWNISEQRTAEHREYIERFFEDWS